MIIYHGMLTQLLQISLPPHGSCESRGGRFRLESEFLQCHSVFSLFACPPSLVRLLTVPLSEYVRRLAGWFEDVVERWPDGKHVSDPPGSGWDPSGRPVDRGKRKPENGVSP